MSKRKPITFDYVNYRKEKSTRTVLPENVWFGKTKYHPEEQWFLRAFDSEKLDYRDFALTDITGFKKDNEQ